jgi:hypothetical protein
VQRLFKRENYTLTGPIRGTCKGVPPPPQIWKIKENNLEVFDLSNGMRKHFLNLNVADIGAKKRFNHVLRRICQGK